MDANTPASLDKQTGEGFWHASVEIFETMRRNMTLTSERDEPAYFKTTKPLLILTVRLAFAAIITVKAAPAAEMLHV